MQASFSQKSIWLFVLQHKSQGRAGLCIFMTHSSPACALPFGNTTKYLKTIPNPFGKACARRGTETQVTGNLIILRRLLWGKSKCFAPLACMWHFPLSLMRRSVRAEPELRPADLAEFGPRACFLTVHIFTNVKYSSAVSFDKARRVLSAPSQ